MTPEQPVAEIDAALAGLENLDAVPLPEHVARFDAMHTALTSALATIDQV
ncbi:hypothetical protein [Crossiella sp. NPDC003009]